MPERWGTTVLLNRNGKCPCTTQIPGRGAGTSSLGLNPGNPFKLRRSPGRKLSSVGWGGWDREVSQLWRARVSPYGILGSGTSVPEPRIQ